MAEISEARGAVMRQPYDSSPFIEEEDAANLLASNSRPDSKRRPSPLAFEPFSFGNRSGNTIDIPMDTLSDTRSNDMDVASWEADLQRRAAFCRKEKNWPPCFPIIHHDISKEIPVRHRRMQYLAFASWLGIVLCLVWNVIAVTASCIIWGVRTESEMRFGLFIMIYTIHICFCLVATIAPPIISNGNSLPGIFTAIDAFSDSVIVGIFYFVGSVLFCLETVFSLYVSGKIGSYFRERDPCQFL